MRKWQALPNVVHNTSKELTTYEIQANMGVDIKM
jgi:hypothetical protein